MGLLTIYGAPLAWGTPENDIAIQKVKEGGIEQFLNIWRKTKDIDGSPFLWGDEIEHLVVNVQEKEDGTKVLKLSLNGPEMIQALTSQANKFASVDWRPEYGSFMVESVPNFPYSFDQQNTCYEVVENNMRKRYQLLDQAAGPHNFCVTLVTYPLMGVGHFTNSKEPFKNDISQSLFVPDVCTNPSHPRFATLTKNIRKRRGKKVCIQVPLYIDTYTMEKTVDKRFNIDASPANDKLLEGTVKSNSEAKDGTGGVGVMAPKGSLVNDSDDSFSIAAAESIGDSFSGPDMVIYSPNQFTNTVNANEGKNYDANTLFARSKMVQIFTPAMDYYYAQYSSHTEKEKQKYVEKRYLCSCMTTVKHPCIYMDCMAFGMGCNCLQLTMQLRNMVETRYVYDQMVVLCPIFLAITAATPFQKGLLCDSDVRWITIAASVDDRKRDEVPRILKSRYDSVSCFISTRVENVMVFNDNHVEIDTNTFKKLISNGVDPILANHISHLFIRDPLVIFDQAIDIDNENRSDHFENIQTTNWQTVRFKPPPQEGNIGWRVEFRVMEVMPTPFENAAFATFVALLTRAIIQFELFFYTRMSIVDENMGKVHQRDPCNPSKRYIFRKNPFTSYLSTSPDETAGLTVNEIFNGSSEYIGLINIVRKYLISNRIESPTVERYLRFISMRAAGIIPNTANYLRSFIMNHPDYKHDSRITPKIALDVAERAHGLSNGTFTDDSYLPMKAFGPEASSATYPDWKVGSSASPVVRVVCEKKK